MNVLKLSFDETHHNRFFWFASRAFQDWNNSFPIHFQTIINLLVAARSEGITIECVEITGFHAGLSQSFVELSTLAMKAFSPIKKIRLEDSFSLMSFFAHLELPFLQQLDLKACSIAGSDLGVFVRKHHDSLRRVNLKGVYLHRGVISSNLCLVPLYKLFGSYNCRESYMVESATLDLEEALLEDTRL